MVQAPSDGLDSNDKTRRPNVVLPVREKPNGYRKPDYPHNYIPSQY
jgi:hypothetical protein